MVLKSAAASLAFLGAAAFQAMASCAQPIIPPLTYERGNWSELETLKVDPPALPEVIRRQDLAGDGHGKLNIDFFAITIDADGQSAADLFSEIRGDLLNIVFANTSYADFGPLNAAQGAKWNSDDPTGAVMAFTLKKIANVMDLERAGVFVSCASSTNFVFSTIEEKDAGLHPVAGNRAFGVHDHGNGTLTVYVKAADRIVDSGIFGVMPEAAREGIFKQGAGVWEGMLDNISNRYKNRNPQGRNEFSQRVDF